jgi:secreted trypsin-like serine protease
MRIAKAALLAISIWAAVLAGTAEAQPPGTRIFGGSRVGIADVPYTAALVRTTAADEFDGQFCGAVVRDTTHVITAAHCVFNSLRPGQAFLPAQVSVLAGRASLATSAPLGADLVPLAGVSVDPDYDPSALSNDAALLTLARPLSFAAAAPKPIALIGADPLSASLWAPGAAAIVSGWGKMESGDFDTELRAVGLPILDDSACSSQFPVYVAATDICAGAVAGQDSCNGDSGGPLVVDGDPGPGSRPRLIGLVSYGSGQCGQEGVPGAYTEVGDPAVRAYLSQDAPPGAPSTATAPVIDVAAPGVGSTVTCSPGTWANAAQLSVELIRGTGGSAVAVMPPSPPGTSYVATAADVGQPLTCVVDADSPAGTGYATSAPTAPVLAAGQSPPAAATTRPHDVLAPVARIVRASCRRSRCTLTIKVADAGFSAGIARVEIRVVSTFRTSCRKGGRTVRCTQRRTRSLKAKRIGRRRYEVALRRLPVGRHVVTVIAVDRAGNRQVVADRRTLRTRRR